jgi:hypothetical protein
VKRIAEAEQCTTGMDDYTICLRVVEIYMVKLLHRLTPCLVNNNEIVE